MYDNPKGVYACTVSGAGFNIVDPDECELPPLTDFALQLARMVRFNGAVDVDIATHSVALCVLVPNQYRLRALLHDASEVILGDMIRPLKRLSRMAGFRRLQAAWEARIYTAYGVTEAEDPAIMVHYDAALIRYEAEQYGAPGVSRFVHNNIPEGTILNPDAEREVRPVYSQAAGMSAERKAQIWLQYVSEHVGNPVFSS